MTDVHELDRTFHFIMKWFIDRGWAPHFTDIASGFSMSPQEGKALLHELLGTGIAAWLFPNTDLLTSFAPFNSLPTPYRISVDGQQKWFGQCGLESLAACWLFPGRDTTIESPCLDCGDLITLVIRDGVIESARPPSIYGYVDIPFRDWRRNLAYT